MQNTNKPILQMCPRHQDSSSLSILSPLPCVGQFKLLSGKAVIIQKEGRHT